MIQNASQGFHYNNDQYIVIPVIYYYREGEEIKHQSFVFLSDCIKHNTTTIYVIQVLLMNDIKKNVNVHRVIYFADGAKQHKKRFQTANLLNHTNDHGVPAEWHFHAIAHGKHAYDGIGTIFKRAATRASLEAPSIQSITNATSLFQWAKKYFHKIGIFFYSEKMHGKTETHLRKRFSEAKVIPYISSKHAFVVLPNGDLQTKIIHFLILIRLSKVHRVDN